MITGTVLVLLCTILSCVALMMKRKAGIESFFRGKPVQSTSLPTTKTSTAPVEIVPHTPRRPKFDGQVLISRNGRERLDEENILLLQNNFLPERELKEYIDHAVQVERFGGKSLYNSIMPRKEICYTLDGKPFRYSQNWHHSARYPLHALSVIQHMNTFFDEAFPGHPFKSISTALDIIYSDEFPFGGSVGAHGDKGEDWGIVAIFSVGQTRWLRVRRRADGAWYNVEMAHNSLVVMYGRSFQALYTHQIDKLHRLDRVYPRISFNVRFLDKESNFDLLWRQALEQAENEEENEHPAAVKRPKLSDSVDKEIGDSALQSVCVEEVDLTNDE